MADISSYPIGTPHKDDLIPGPQVRTDDNNNAIHLTRNFSVSSIAGFANVTAGYNVYAARLNAGAGAAPTVNILQNNTGLTFTWTRTGAGIFLATVSGGTIAADDFWAQVGAKGTEFPSIKWNTTTTCQINNILCNTAATVDGITEGYVEIRIYT